MKKAINYGMQGVVRTGISGSGVIFASGIAKLHFEAIALQNLQSDNPNATSSEIYEESGIISKYIIRNDCNIDTADLGTSLESPEVISCVRKDFEEVSEFPTTTALLPVVFIGVFCLKAMPRGLAYFQIALRELIKSDRRVLREEDFIAYRASRKQADFNVKP